MLERSQKLNNLDAVHDSHLQPLKDHTTERTAPLLNQDHLKVEYPHKKAFHSSAKGGNGFKNAP